MSTTPSVRRAAGNAGLLATVALLFTSGAVANATTGSLTYIRDGNVFASSADGGAEAQLTHDGSPTDPYVSATQSSTGMVVAIRHDTAYRLRQSGQTLAPPVSLGFASGGAVSADGLVLAYEEISTCGIVPRACRSTAFRSLASGVRLSGTGLQMSNPTWAGASVVGAVSGSVGITAPDQPGGRVWFGSASDPVPLAPVGTQNVVAAAASAGGARVATISSAGNTGERALWLFTAQALDGPVQPVCWQAIPPGPDGHPVWSPTGNALAWEDADGIWVQEVVDLSGTDDGCLANVQTARLVVPEAVRPNWSAAPFDPSPVAAVGTGGATSGAVSGNRATPGQAASPGSPTPSTAERPSFRFASRTSLARALHSGITLRVSCPSRCSATAAATVDARTARQFMLGRRAIRVAAGRVRTIEPGTTAPLRLHFTRPARRHLSRAGRLRIAVTVTYTNAARSTTRSRKVLMLR